MDLLLDLGHTRLKWAWWSGGGMAASGACPWQGLNPAELLTAFGTGEAIPERVAIAAVAGAQLVADLMREIRLRLRVEPVLLRATARRGDVVNGYTDPGQLGVDRWMAVLGAWGRAPGSASVVVDAGSALTIDLLQGDGRHLGGSIAPGLDLSSEAFYARTARTVQRGTAQPHGAGRNTADAVATGALLGAAGAVERVWRHHARTAGASHLWLTGGDAPTLSAALEVPHTLVANLVFEGMALMLGDRA